MEPPTSGISGEYPSATPPKTIVNGLEIRTTNDGLVVVRLSQPLPVLRAEDTIAGFEDLIADTETRGTLGMGVVDERSRE